MVQDLEYQLTGLSAFTPGSDQTIRRCKIIGTIGPSSSTPEVQRQLIEAGLDIARLNFSHGEHKVHEENLANLRAQAESLGRRVAILQDLQGPKIRAGKLIGDLIDLNEGDRFDLVFGTEQTDPNIIPIDYEHLATDVKPGHRILLDDGKLSMVIKSIDEGRIHVQVVDGGPLKSRKGINFPDSVLSLPAMTEKDRRDLLFGVKMGVDYIALSFVQKAEDVREARRMISALGADIPIIAKIEKNSAVEDIDEITQEADGLMVARGDLGVEAQVEKVPIYQRKIIEAGSRQAKPVIIATQMLESMITNPHPTAAEMADVANGVLDGADCVMLSGEVAAGKFPVACVRQMDSIIKNVEAWANRKMVRYHGELQKPESPRWDDHEAIAIGACEAADALSAKVIVCLTLTGSIAKQMSRWRPRTPIVAISPRDDVVRRLTAVWGVYALQNPLFYNTDLLLFELPNLLAKLQLASSGDYIVITAGIPIEDMSPTNMIKINRIP